MPRRLKLEYVRNRLPVCYRHKPVFRWFMILISFSILVYSIYFMIIFVNADSPVFLKLMPLGIAYVGLDSVLKKITSLNSVTFDHNQVRFGFIAKKPLEIPYQNIISLIFYRKITYYIGFTYIDNQGIEQKYRTQASFPHSWDILLNLADLAPHATIPEHIQGIFTYLKECAND